jgi:hypothetical protein
MTGPMGADGGRMGRAATLAAPGCWRPDVGFSDVNIRRGPPR